VNWNSWVTKNAAAKIAPDIRKAVRLPLANFADGEQPQRHHRLADAVLPGEEYGNPIVDRSSVGVTGPETVLGGYSSIKADSLAGATELAKGCPTLRHGGGVAESAGTRSTAGRRSSLSGNASIPPSLGVPRPAVSGSSVSVRGAQWQLSTRCVAADMRGLGPHDRVCELRSRAAL
jgi:hypothetical protein